MFLAQAHSFAQQSRLAITLSFVAGYTNILTVLTCGQVTSHMTGLASEVGRDAVAGRWILGAYALLLLTAFFVGALVAGFLTEHGRRHGWQSIYVLPIALEAGLLAGFAMLVELHDAATLETGWVKVLMTTLPAMAMGLQNATITRISGGVVRTTHVTGVLTDLGLESAQALHNKRDAWAARPSSPPPEGAPATPIRLALLATILAAFMLGSGAGTFLFSLTPQLSMIPPVLFLIWMIYQDTVRPIAELHAADHVGGANIEQLSPEVAVYHVRANSRTRTAAGARSRRSRAVMPDLNLWAERLPPQLRVVVLDLSDFHELDSTAALEIRALARRLAGQQRTLVIGGIDSEGYRSLERRGVLSVLRSADVFGDVELAVARGLSLVPPAAHR